MATASGLLLRSSGRPVDADTQPSQGPLKTSFRRKARPLTSQSSVTVLVMMALTLFMLSSYRQAWVLPSSSIKQRRLPETALGRPVNRVFTVTHRSSGTGTERSSSNSSRRQGGSAPGSGDSARSTHYRDGMAANERNGIPRPPAAVRLEALVDSSPVLGSCYQQRPLLEGMPRGSCQPLTCMWSETLQANMDLQRLPLTPLPTATQGELDCPPPQGGQRGLPEGGGAVISFVIAMYNGGTVTAQCLLELFRTAREVESAEFILVNDGSTEDVSAAEKTLKSLHTAFGIQHVYMETSSPEGYGAANTKGIKAASGEFVALINNDMFVTRGWLHPLMHTFAQDPQAGLVGPLFMGDQHLVQEAGGLVFSDGSAANFGRGTEHNHLLGYMRETDYISAACVVMRREEFFKLGGFDHQYQMGYFEDTDFAMAVRARGLKVLLQPLSVVFHQEGGTFGTDDTSELKRQLMDQNGAKFSRKWGAVLQANHCPSSAGAFAAVARFGSPRIMWIDDIAPEPDRDSGSIRTLNILRILLRQGYHVTFAATAGGRDARYAAQVRAMGVDVLTSLSPFQWRMAWKGRCLYDAMYIARREVYRMAKDAVREQCPQAPIIYDTVDLHFFREAREGILAQEQPQRTENSQPSATWPLAQLSTSHVLNWLDSGGGQQGVAVRAKRDVEMQLISQSDVTVVVSSEEVDVIRHYNPQAKVEVLSNIHQMEPLPPTPSCPTRSGMLFVGNMNHIPNREAVDVLIRDVLPAILEGLPAESAPRFRLHVVGSNIAPEWLLQLMQAHSSHVTFHGNLPDDELWDLYTQVRVVVAPLLSGAGVKGKVNQAMKYGVPVVATPLAVEGMHATHGRDCLLAQDPQGFADQVVRLHANCTLWSILVEGGLENMRKHFSLETAEPVVLKVFSEVGAAPLPPVQRGKCRAPEAAA